MAQPNSNIDEEVYDRVRLFHTDSVICGVSALALKTNAPNILRNEAIKNYSVNPKLKIKEVKNNMPVSKCFGSKVWTNAEKSIAANSSAVREWDSNGTLFGYNKKLGHTAGEFGHNDYYPVVIAAA